MLHGHGNDIYKYRNKIIADFSSNVVYGGISKELEQHLIENIKNIANYPEPDAESLKSKIAAFYNLDYNNVIVNNGSTESFYLLAQLFQRKESVIITPSFSEYEDACRIHNHKLKFISNSELNHDTKFESDMVWIGNPNNPDGKVISNDIILKFCTNNPECSFIIDEAYAELCKDYKSCIHLINEVSNLVVIRSLTKVFALPGIRLGYVLTNEHIQKQLQAIKIPWTVNSLAIEAGKHIMDNYSQFLPDINLFLNQSKQLQKQLSEIEELEIINSDCNYFLVKLKIGKSNILKDYLINNYGLLIRDASNFNGLNDSYIRIAVQQETLNNKLVEAIKQWYK